MAATKQGLSQGMRSALLDEHGSRQTLQALERRGLVQNAPTHSIRGHFTAFLTDAGRRVAQVLRNEMDATPVIETVTVTVPAALARRIDAAWTALYDGVLEGPQAAAAALELAAAYEALRTSGAPDWLSRMALDARDDAHRTAREL